MQTLIFCGGLLCAFLFPVFMVMAISKAIKGEDYAATTVFSGISFLIVVLAILMAVMY